MTRAGKGRVDSECAGGALGHATVRRHWRDLAHGTVHSDFSLPLREPRFPRSVPRRQPRVRREH